MITKVGNQAHLTIDAMLLVLDWAAFLQAIQRGKAVRRAQAQRAREAQMAEAAERKRESLTSR